MKSLSPTKSTALIIAVIAASIVVVPQTAGAQGNSTPGTSVEVTPEFVCNPNATRWNTPGGKGGYFAREVQDLHVYNGKIYTAGGDWGAFSNQGPVPIFAIDPATGSFTNEFEAGTELITDFKEFSDGRLWAGSVDNRESHENAGHFFRRELDGTWTNLTSCISGHNGATANYAAHIWDIAEFGGKFFTAGYGICASSNWGDTRMTDATPDLTTPYRTYFESSTSVWIAGQNRFNVGQARKFAAFMPFDDDLFCFSMDYGYKYYMDIFEWEEWRWDASLGKFVASLVPWSDIAPGITEEDKAITVSPSMSDYLDFDIRPSHCRKFGSRMLYLIEGIKTNVAGHSRPWAAYSAVNVNHHVKATKIDLGGARPFDIHVSDDAAYIVAAKGTEMGSVVTNSVWKTEDGVTFTELFYFATNRQATALCKYGDDFYIGMGYSTNVCNIWKNLPKDPELSGDIYRVNLEGGSQGGEDPQGEATITNGVWEIGSYGEFAAAITEDSPADAKYRLTADINLASWSAVDFRGVLDGNGHTLEGLASPLFNTISGGRVQNLAISSSTVASEANGVSIGFIARTLECGASVSNCTIKAGCQLRAGNNVKCGAIAGNIVKGADYAGETFSGIFDCTNHALIEKTTGDYNTVAGGNGGIVGHIDVSLPDGQSSVECRIERCFNDGTLASTHAACNLGGIVGYAIVNNDAGALSIVGCQNAGSISNTSAAASTQYVTTHAGGIVGNVGGPYHGAIEISRCANRGVVLSGYEPEDSSFSKKCAGGFVGNVVSFYKDARLAIVDSANYGAVSGNRAAGLVAQIGANVNYIGTAVVLSNVANYAAISGVTNIAQAIGSTTVPAVAHDRSMVNAFFADSANAGVPLFGDSATDGDFATETVIVSSAEGYAALPARNALNAIADSAGLEHWVLGKVGRGSGAFIAPELACFMTKIGKPGFKVSLR